MLLLLSILLNPYHLELVAFRRPALLTEHGLVPALEYGSALLTLHIRAVV
jgi:hypothetical protein